MAPPGHLSLEQIESLAFAAMTGGIGISHSNCSCAMCRSSHRSRDHARACSPATKRNESGAKASNVDKATTNGKGSGKCNHGKFDNRPDSQQQPKGKSVSPTKSTPAQAPSQREQKINALLRASKEQTIFEVFNLTEATKEETALVQTLQAALKNCKSYGEVKEKVIEVCAESDVNLDAIAGLLAKFRHERNLLVTAVLKSNAERTKAEIESDKAILCIKHVDDLLKHFRAITKRSKDAKSVNDDNFINSLDDIREEIHELAQTPSTLYEDYIDLKRDHEELSEDHEEMQAKFMEVNGCHDKLHANHDKLEQKFNNLTSDFNEMKKKASLVGGLKNDVGRLEKLNDRQKEENVDLKKEVDKLTAELTKVNALKHENAQLKKKIAVLANVPQPSEPTQPTLTEPVKSHSTNTQSHGTTAAAKKKKGKKGQIATTELSETTEAETEAAKVSAEVQNKHEEALKSSAAEVAKLRKSHDSIMLELDNLKGNLKQLEMVRRKAEEARDSAFEKLHLEQATSQNWKGIADTNITENKRLCTDLEDSQNQISRLEAIIHRLEGDFTLVNEQLAEQRRAYEHVKGKLDVRMHIPSAPTAPLKTLSQDNITILNRIRDQTTQLGRDLDDVAISNVDIRTFFHVLNINIRKTIFEIEKDVEQIMTGKSSDEILTVPSTYSETVPSSYSYNSNNELRYTSSHLPSLLSQSEPDINPQDSPNIAYNNNMNYGFNALRPLVPPGFGEPSPAPSSTYNYGRATDFQPINRGLTPSSTPSGLNVTPPQNYAMHHSPVGNAGLGPIGSRSTSMNQMSAATAPIGTGKPTGNGVTPSPIGTPAPIIATANGARTVSNAGVGAGNGPKRSSVNSGLGNGAVGVDWSMWSKK